MDAGQEFLLTGTASGEVCAYFLSSRLFRGALPVAANGVHGLCTVPSQGVTMVGGGDGVLRKIQGRDTEWAIRGEVCGGHAGRAVVHYSLPEGRGVAPL